MIKYEKLSKGQYTGYRVYGQTSGVVGRECMGTAFPHKKLSGNGVPTREILKDIFLLLLLN